MEGRLQESASVCSDFLLKMLLQDSSITPPPTPHPPTPQSHPSLNPESQVLGSSHPCRGLAPAWGKLEELCVQGYHAGAGNQGLGIQSVHDSVYNLEGLRAAFMLQSFGVWSLMF